MVVFERFYIFSSTFYLLSNKYSNLEDSKEIYYIDTGSISLFFIPLISHLFNYKINQLEFSLKDIKDNSGELERLKLTREYLFQIKSLIICSPQYKTILADLYSTNNSSDEYLRSYFEKSIIHSEIMEPGLWRTVFLIKVIKSFMKKKLCKSTLFIINNRPWIHSYQEFSAEDGILIASQKVFLKYKFRSPMEILRSMPTLHFLLKVLKYRRGSLKKENKKNNSLYLEGRGDLVLEKNGSHSDFLWQMDSDFPPESIVYQYENKEERLALDLYGIDSEKISPYLGDLINQDAASTSLSFIRDFNDESKQIRDYSNFYNSNYLTSRSFFKRKNIKIYLTWNKYDADHMIKADAVRSLDGVSVIWQIAFDGFQTIENYTHSDIVFSYSKLSEQLNSKIGSKYSYNVITGSTKDYKNLTLVKKAEELRNKISSNGAKNIVSVFDENSVDDDRWHTGHSLQQDNYKFILEELLENKNLGIIFKPKSGKTLRKRLGEVNTLLEIGERTGRCIVLDDINRQTSAASPIIASLASDLCVHGHLCAGSAGLEAYLAGTPTILIDREGCPESKLYELPKGKVIFKNWPETITSINNFFASNKIMEGFGDWEPIIDDLEPFRDGLGAKRMGFFLHKLKEAFDEGQSRETAIIHAVNEYSKEWGSNKVIYSKTLT